MNRRRICLWAILLVAAVPVVGYAADPTDAIFARNRYFSAKSELNRIHIQLERQFLQSPAWSTARASLIDASGRLLTLRRPLIDAVRSSPAYQRIWQQKYTLEKQLEDVYAAPPSAARDTDIYALANRLLDLRQSLTQLESEALDAEPAIKQTKQELVAANDQLRALWDQHTRSIPADPSWQRAHRRMETAYAQWIAAAGRFQQANDRDWESNRQRLVSIGNLDASR